MPTDTITFPCNREESVFRGRGWGSWQIPAAVGAAVFSHVCSTGTQGVPVLSPLPEEEWRRRGCAGSWLQKAEDKRFPRESSGCQRRLHSHYPGQEMLASSAPCPVHRKALRNHPKKEQAERLSYLVTCQKIPYSSRLPARSGQPPSCGARGSLSCFQQKGSVLGAHVGSNRQKQVLVAPAQMLLMLPSAHTSPSPAALSLPCWHACCVALAQVPRRHQDKKAKGYPGPVSRWC